jgi:hypothetical protein
MHIAERQQVIVDMRLRVHRQFLPAIADIDAGLFQPP